MLSDTGDQRGLSVTELASGNLVVVGYTERNGPGDRDGWILLFDREGTLLWQRAYGAAGADDELRSVQRR
jgi:hypothetical protein